MLRTALTLALPVTVLLAIGSGAAWVLGMHRVAAISRLRMTSVLVLILVLMLALILILILMLLLNLALMLMLGRTTDDGRR